MKYIWYFPKNKLTLPTKVKPKKIMAKKDQLTTSDHLPYDEYLNLLKGLHEDKQYMFELYARLSFCTACRASDVLQFRWKDVLGSRKCTVTEKKTGKTREIPINATVQTKIAELYNKLGSPDRDSYIFTGSNRETPLTIQYVNRRLKTFKVKYRLSIDHFSTHTFRKTFGRYVYDSHNHSAESLLLLNRILNHSNIETTKRYIGITKEEINKVFDSISF